MRTLLLITFSGARYGVWEDAVSSVIGALPLHRLPLSPPAIAGIALLEDHSTAIADLGACLGVSPRKGLQDGTFLIIHARDKIAGFRVEGSIERLACPPERVHSLPTIVASPVADTCAESGVSLIPIINIGSLLDRLKQGLLELPSPEPGPPARAIDLSRVRGVRMFSAGGVRFCVDAEGSGYAARGADGIAPVPVRSGRFAGVVLHDGAVVPVMTPGVLPGAGGQVDGQGVLFAGPRGARYGIVVDEDLGVVEVRDPAVLALPVLAARPWFPAAVLSQERGCLLVDINLLASSENTGGAHSASAVFHPASRFSAQFRKNDTDIVEFSLLGGRHAVPKEEVSDVHPVLPYVPVPGTPEIILGVAELRGELLPVLDLAAIFGRRSPIGKKGRMLHIVNGDFQALVVSGDVAAGRQLPVEAQRQVPIVLPHQVLYGCYLEAGMVRLILNVQSLAVHFEKTSVRELVASLSPDIVGQPDQPREARKPAAPDAPAAEAGPEAGHAASMEHARETAPTAPGDGARAAAIDEERVREEARMKAAVEAAGQELARQRVEAERLRAEDVARSRAAVQDRLKAEADAAAQEERRLSGEAERISVEEKAHARADAEAEARERERARRKAAEDAAMIAVEELRKREEEEARRTAGQHAGIAAEENAKREADEAHRRREGEAKRREETAAAEEITMMPVPPGEPRFPPAPASSEGRPAERKRGKHIGIAVVIGILLVFIIYFVSIPKKPAPQGPSKPETTGKQTATQMNAPHLEKEPPLYLTVPPDKAVPDPTVYTVIKGDNLWTIAKRFTGDPLNYPRVAKDNSIATPDLIFPGQRIRIRNEQAPRR